MHVCGEREIERERGLMYVYLWCTIVPTGYIKKKELIRERVEETREKTRKLSVSVALPFATSPAVACVCTVVK